MSKYPNLVSFERSSAYVHHRAMMNRRDNNIVDAVELLRSAVEKSPDNPEYRLDLAELYCEMGCHSQSNRLLLDMLSEGDAPAECYYGLALNQLAANDLRGARKSLRMYGKTDPDSASNEGYRQIVSELDYYTEINAHGNRGLRRAERMAAQACDAMKSDETERAIRLFERTLKLSPELRDMRALYAMALLMSGAREAAVEQATLACEGDPPSVKALCVSAQVFHILGDQSAARMLIDRAIEQQPAGLELRLMVYAMGEMDMFSRAAEFARLALQETPYDRDMMHMRAIALKRSGSSNADVAKIWTRILRIDPEDSVARFYQQAAEQGGLDDYALEFSYQVPEEEFKRRVGLMVGHLSLGFEHLVEQWNADKDFRQLVKWAARTEDERLSRAAVTALTAIDNPETRSELRQLLFTGDTPAELKLHAALVMRLQGQSTEALMPEGAGLNDGILPDAEALMARLSVGERQLIRYAEQVLRREYGASGLTQLTLIWTAYRQGRGTHCDPLKCIEGASAALAYNYLSVYAQRPEIGPLCRAFGCAPRQMVFYASRIADCLEKMGEITLHEDP